MSERLTNKEAGAIGHARALAECRNQCYADALRVIRQQTVHLRRGDLDASAAFAANIDDSFTRALRLSRAVAEAYHAPKSPAADQASMDALFPLEEAARILLDEIGIEQAAHSAIYAMINARLGAPAADQASMDALFPLEEAARILLDEIGIEQAAHSAIYAMINARLGAPAPISAEELPMP